MVEIESNLIRAVKKFYVKLDKKKMAIWTSFAVKDFKK